MPIQSQCPVCQNPIEIEPASLRLACGLVRCGLCQSFFKLSPDGTTGDSLSMGEIYLQGIHPQAIPRTTTWQDQINESLDDDLSAILRTIENQKLLDSTSEESESEANDPTDPSNTVIPLYFDPSNEDKRDDLDETEDKNTAVIPLPPNLPEISETQRNGRNIQAIQQAFSSLSGEPPSVISPIDWNENDSKRSIQTHSLETQGDWDNASDWDLENELTDTYVSLPPEESREETQDNEIIPFSFDQDDFFEDKDDLDIQLPLDEDDEHDLDDILIPTEITEIDQTRLTFQSETALISEAPTEAPFDPFNLPRDEDEVILNQDTAKETLEDKDDLDIQLPLDEDDEHDLDDILIPTEVTKTDPVFLTAQRQDSSSVQSTLFQLGAYGLSSDQPSAHAGSIDIPPIATQNPSATNSMHTLGSYQKAKTENLKQINQEGFYQEHDELEPQTSTAPFIPSQIISNSKNEPTESRVIPNIAHESTPEPPKRPYVKRTRPRYRALKQRPRAFARRAPYVRPAAAHYSPKRRSFNRFGAVNPVSSSAYYHAQREDIIHRLELDDEVLSNLNDYAISSPVITDEQNSGFFLLSMLMFLLLMVLLGSVWMPSRLYEIPLLRPFYYAVCYFTECKQKHGGILSEIEVETIRLSPEGQDLRLEVDLINQSGTEMRYPKLLIVLYDHDLEVIVSNVFLPEQYLANYRRGRLASMTPHSRNNIVLRLRRPQAGASISHYEVKTLE